MKRKRFTEEQIIGVLKEHEPGCEDSRSVPQAWDHRGDLLQLEEQIRRYCARSSDHRRYPRRSLATSGQHRYRPNL
jgi:hypothetical protein